jgi:c-di-GMP-binding flagellar brake protein YcgR
MFIITELRKDERIGMSETFRYSVIISRFKTVEKIPDTAVSIDISRGGIGLLTGTMLETGHVMVFDTVIRLNDISAQIAVVKWVDRYQNQYRVGLQFV